MTRRSVVLAALLALGLFLHGRAEAGPEGWPKDIVIGGGPSAVTSHYLIGAYWGDLLRKEFGVRATPITSSSEKNCLGVGKGQITAGYAVGPIPQWAVFGDEVFKPNGKQPIRVIAMTADLYIDFFTLKKNGIQSIADLRGKNFSASYKGASYLDLIVKEVLGAYGLSEKDVTIGAFGQAPEPWSNVASGHADAGASTDPLGMAYVREFFMTQDGRYLPLNEKAIKRVTEKFDWAVAAKIPGGSYKGVDADVPTVKLRMMLFVHRDTPDDLVYQLVKYMYHPDYRAGFERIHQTVKSEILLDRAVKDATIPFHPGAVKFYKEVGQWSPAVEAWQQAYLKRLGEQR